MIDSISFIIPSYNESENIENLYNRITNLLNDIHIKDYEIIYIENGSTDNSFEILKKLNLQNNSVKVISFTRNFGLQNAIYAGLNFAKKKVVCVLDGDLQDPPEIVKDFLIKMNKGYDIVYGIRKKRQANFLKKIFYKIFYYLFNKFSEVPMPTQAGEFCLMNQKVVKNILEFREKNLFIRGLRTWTGFKQTGIEYSRPERNAGKAKFSFLDAFYMALDGLISFSLAPLRFILFLGIIISFFALLFSSILFILKILSVFNFLSQEFVLLMPKGLSFTNILLLVFFSLILLALGIIAEYLAKIYSEVKDRPRYIIKEMLQ